MEKKSKIVCGELLRKWLKNKKKSQRWLADYLHVPTSTVSNWLNAVDIKVSNIYQCCEALGIEVWQFFAPDDLVLPKFSPGQKAFFTAFAEMPEELQGKALDHLNDFLEAYISGKEARYR